LKDNRDLELLGRELEGYKVDGERIVFHRMGIKFLRKKTIRHPIKGIPRTNMYGLANELERFGFGRPLGGDENVLIYGEEINCVPQVIFVQSARLYTAQNLLIPETARKIMHPDEPGNILEGYVIRALREF
jgi:hypothetical protein